MKRIMKHETVEDRKRIAEAVKKMKQKNLKNFPPLKEFHRKHSDWCTGCEES